MKHEEGISAIDSFEQWQATVPNAITQDSVWLVEAYRLALFLSDLAWNDSNRIAHDFRLADVADQLRRATRKISACIEEGYSRDTGKGRATFYEYALGSARESRGWYFKGRCALDSMIVQHRMDLCTQIIRLTLRMVANERRSNRRASEA